MEDSQRRLIRHGLALFLIGLLTGLVEQHFTNIRMGLAAHLEGVMNGTFLLALGSAWKQVNLTARTKAIAYRLFLVGTYGNWFVTTLAAILGTAALSPVTANGFGANALQESIVTLGFVTIGLALIVGVALALWGLRTTRA
jgi:(hydroxyamino)benzene mutase